ncbi:MAG TPA: hypothetical protein VMW35_07755 [Myxococcota bacterium]|jgi:hypothetical protein|nr:hypothetical protein [Myxococcota bacterium]
MALIHVLTTRPRPDMARTYEGIVQRIAERARSTNEKFRWTAHQTIHGAPPAYHFVSEAADWTTLGAGDVTAVAFVMRLFGSKDGQKVRDELAACAGETESIIGRDRPDLSCAADEPELARGRAPFGMVTRLVARSGHQDAVEELVRKIAEAIPKVDDPTRVSTYQVVIGPLRSYWTVRPLTGLGDLDAQSMPGDLLTRAFGAGEGGLVYRSGLEALESTVRTIAALRPELSNMG